MQRQHTSSVYHSLKSSIARSLWYFQNVIGSHLHPGPAKYKVLWIRAVNYTEDRPMFKGELHFLTDTSRPSDSVAFNPRERGGIRNINFMNLLKFEAKYFHFNYFTLKLNDQLSESTSLEVAYALNSISFTKLLIIDEINHPVLRSNATQMFLTIEPMAGCRVHVANIQMSHWVEAFLKHTTINEIILFNDFMVVRLRYTNDHKQVELIFGQRHHHDDNLMTAQRIINLVTKHLPITLELHRFTTMTPALLEEILINPSNPLEHSPKILLINCFQVAPGFLKDIKNAVLYSSRLKHFSLYIKDALPSSEWETLFKELEVSDNCTLKSIDYNVVEANEPENVAYEKIITEAERTDRASHQVLRLR